MTTAQKDATDRNLLNQIQMSFPLEPTPFATLAQRLGTSEEEVLARCRRLKEEGIIRQVSAIFDSRRLGYSSTLIAMDIPEETIDEAAMRISEHPGVSHNYKRHHPFNLWFTLTLPPGQNVAAQANALAKVGGARRFRILPALRLFKIGVELDMETGVNAARDGLYQQDRPYASRPKLTPEEKEYVRVLQQDLPFVPRPFRG
ncbi:MAG: Lrp/AsnC family transcriptional regulator, partial [Dehalococcoidia bacterium]